MKKFFLSTLLVLTALTGAMAAWPDRPISLVKAPGTPKDPVPGTVNNKNQYFSMLENTEWCSASRGFEDPVILSRFVIEGDTSIQNVLYKKIQRRACYLREDNIGKVFMLSPINSDQEVLLYDFSLQVGDEFVGFGDDSCIVTQVDSFIDREGLTRKRLHLQHLHSCDATEIVWIEGFGNICTVENPTFVDVRHQAVVCIKRGQDVCYESLFLGKTCDDFNATSIFCAEAELSISPNPVHETLNVHIEDDSMVQLRVYSMVGDLVLSESGCTLNVSSLPNGVYLLTCMKGDKLLLSKFIKE